MSLPRVIAVFSMFAGIAVVASQSAAAEEANLPFSQRPPRLDHRHQLGISLMPGIGYRMIARYEEGQSCLDDSRDDGKWVCTNDVPAFLDLQFSYGATPRMDVMADLRVGLALDDAVGVGRQLAVAPGIRLWLDRDVRLKFFTTLQFLYDATKQGQARVRNSDFGLRNANGLMYDAFRNLGFYVQFGENLGVVRWFRIEVDIGLGLQVRMP
jgi:hypothetical protein